METYLIVRILKETGKLSRTELWEEVHNRQVEILGEYAHSRSSFYYWLNELKEHGIIDGTPERNGLVWLTVLGQWLSKSPDGDFKHRLDFLIYAICNNCSSHTQTVIFTPKMSTLYLSKRGIINVETQCPACKKESFVKITDMERDIFKTFWNTSISDLREHLSGLGYTLTGKKG